jgi:short-subunit dehydrogenase
MSRWALVTGATAGIGESFARKLAGEGFNLILVARDEARLAAKASQLEEAHCITTHVIVADLTTETGCDAVERYIDEHEVDVLINNAGYGLNQSFTKSEIDEEQKVLNILVRTPMRLTHRVLPQMKLRNAGVIVNVASVAGFIAGGAYSAMKSYLTVLTESLHADLASTNIKVSALCPGFTRTEFHQRAGMKMNALPNIMWRDSDRLVEKAWKDANRGKAVSVPGWQYKTLIFVIKFAPRNWVRRAGMGLRRKQR